MPVLPKFLFSTQAFCLSPHELGMSLTQIYKFELNVYFQSQSLGLFDKYKNRKLVLRQPLLPNLFLYFTEKTLIQTRNYKRLCWEKNAYLEIVGYSS